MEAAAEGEESAQPHCGDRARRTRPAQAGAPTWGWQRARCRACGGAGRSLHPLRRGRGVREGGDRPLRREVEAAPWHRGGEVCHTDVAQVDPLRDVSMYSGHDAENDDRGIARETQACMHVVHECQPKEGRV